MGLPFFYMFSPDVFFIIFFLKGLLLLFRLKNVLIILFAIEFITVNLLFAFVYLSIPYDGVRILIFLAIAAGEASIGLSLMISILRQMGNDKLLVIN